MSANSDRKSRKCALHLTEDSLTIDRDGWYVVRRFHGKDTVEYAEKPPAVDEVAEAGRPKRVELRLGSKILFAMAASVEQGAEEIHDRERRRLKTHSCTVIPPDLPFIFQLLMDRINRLEALKGKIDSQQPGAPKQDTVRDRRKRARELRAQGKKLAQIKVIVDKEFETDMSIAQISQDINGRKPKRGSSHK